VVLLAGEPGVGKSTLLLDVAQQWAAGQLDTGPALVVSGEESTSQVRLRAERIGALHERLYLAAETDLGALLGPPGGGEAGPARGRLVQTISISGTDGVAGGVPRSAPSPPPSWGSPRSAASP
jgi:DNA repair protein RadA/Sms